MSREGKRDFKPPSRELRATFKPPSRGKRATFKNKTRQDKDKTETNERDSPTRHKYGEYKNVLLSDSDLEKLKAEIPDKWQDYIERVSGYVQSTGKTYKDYLATIRNWYKKDREKQTDKELPTHYSDGFLETLYD